MKTQSLKFCGLLLIALAVCNSLALADTVNATVSSVKGDVEVAPPGSVTFAPVKAGDSIVVGSTVRTGEESEAVIITTPGTAIRVDADSVLKINALAFAQTNGVVTQRKADLDLKSGAVSALIDPSTPRVTDFKIQTPQGGACARGTFYAVAVKDGKAYVNVKHGKVNTIPPAPQTPQ